MIKIAKYDLEGNFLEFIEEANLNQIAVLEQVDYTSLKRNLNNLLLSCKGFQYKPVDPNVNVPVKVPAVWHLVDGKYTSNVGLIGKYYKGKLICTYESLTDLADKNKLNDITLLSRQLKQNKTVKKGGFTFSKLK